jgi:hypothetical protein
MMMTNNDDNFRWDCIKGTRAIKDKISAELNAMTPEERHLYFAKLNVEARHRKAEREREREKVL